MHPLPININSDVLRVVARSVGTRCRRLTAEQRRMLPHVLRHLCHGKQMPQMQNGSSDTDEVTFQTTKALFPLHIPVFTAIKAQR